ncbi:ROK family transcriptional regulator [Streptomyces sp. AD681]|nr:ROK family transcriptional regulator [Streptomyces sp. AD681]MDA5147529.1 ROK family transcriptional regulator [Streptomyces sp. AD681]
MHPASEPRVVNRSLVLSDLLSGHPRERSQIVESTGLSRATVFRVVDELRARGLVRTSAAAAGPATGPGRPSRPVEFNGRVHAVCAVDLGGTNCRFAVADALGVTLARSRHPTPHHLDGVGMGRWMAERVHELAALAAGEAGPLGAVAVGVPGPVSGDHSRVVGAHNLPQIVGTEFVDTFREETGVPTTVDNDSNLALVGELQYGSLAESETAALLTLGTGLGSAVALGGRVLYGPAGVLGEYGRLLLPGSEVRLRDLVSGAGLLAHARAGGHEVSSAQEILENPERYGALHAQVVGALVHLVSIVGLSYEPRTVVVTGGFSAGLRDDLLATVQQEVADVVGVQTRLCRTALGDSAGLLGALAVALSDLYASFGALEEHIATVEVDRPRVVKSHNDSRVRTG